MVGADGTVTWGAGTEAATLEGGPGTGELPTAPIATALVTSSAIAPANTVDASIQRPISLGIRPSPCSGFTPVVANTPVNYSRTRNS
jgi:hypothetical protein